MRDRRSDRDRSNRNRASRHDRIAARNAGLHETLREAYALGSRTLLGVEKNVDFVPYSGRTKRLCDFGRLDRGSAAQGGAQPLIGENFNATERLTQSVPRESMWV
jgi:hypothetical protein